MFGDNQTVDQILEQADQAYADMRQLQREAEREAAQAAERRRLAEVKAMSADLAKFFGNTTLVRYVCILDRDTRQQFLPLAQWSGRMDEDGTIWLYLIVPDVAPVAMRVRSTRDEFRLDRIEVFTEWDISAVDEDGYVFPWLVGRHGSLYAPDQLAAAIGHARTLASMWQAALAEWSGIKEIDRHWMQVRDGIIDRAEAIADVFDAAGANLLGALQAGGDE